MPATRRARASGTQATPSRDGAAAQRGVGHLDGPVPVGVGLEHDHHLGARCPSGQPADVVGHRRQVDLQPGGPVGLDDAERLPGPVLADQQLRGVDALGQELLDHPLHPGHRTPLDQHHRVGAEAGRRPSAAASSGVNVMATRSASRPAFVAASAIQAADVALGHQQVDHLGRPPPDGAVQLLGWPPRARPCRRAPPPGTRPGARPACPDRRAPSGARRCSVSSSRRLPPRPARGGAVRAAAATRPTAATASSRSMPKRSAYGQGGQARHRRCGHRGSGTTTRSCHPSWWQVKVVPDAVTPPRSPGTPASVRRRT